MIVGIVVVGLAAAVWVGLVAAMAATEVELLVAHKQPWYTITSMHFKCYPFWVFLDDTSSHNCLLLLLFFFIFISFLMLLFCIHLLEVDVCNTSMLTS